MRITPRYRSLFYWGAIIGTLGFFPSEKKYVLFSFKDFCLGKKKQLNHIRVLKYCIKSTLTKIFTHCVCKIYECIHIFINQMVTQIQGACVQVYNVKSKNQICITPHVVNMDTFLVLPHCTCAATLNLYCHYSTYIIGNSVIDMPARNILCYLIC